MLLEGPGRLTEVEGESNAFEEIRQLAEDHGAKPGETFNITLDLQEYLDEIIVQHNLTDFGQLELSDTDKEKWATILDDSGALEVNARIWTSRDWENNFYASVRVDLPSTEDALNQLEDEHRRYVIETYGTENPTREQVNRRADEQLAKSKNPEISRAARERLGQTESLPTLPATQAEPASEPTATTPEWSDLLSSDGTPSANLFQRGYARGTAGKAMGNIKAPRIDYATVGQCKRIVSAFGGDVSEIDKRGTLSLRLLWWALVFLLAIVALAGIVTPPAGWVISALVAWPFIHHYATRRKLEPPFAPDH